MQYHVSSIHKAIRVYAWHSTLYCRILESVTIVITSTGDLFLPFQSVDAMWHTRNVYIIVLVYFSCHISELIFFLVPKKEPEQNRWSQEWKQVCLWYHSTFWLPFENKKCQHLIRHRHPFCIIDCHPPPWSVKLLLSIK